MSRIVSADLDALLAQPGLNIGVSAENSEVSTDRNARDVFRAAERLGLRCVAVDLVGYRDYVSPGFAAESLRKVLDDAPAGDILLVHGLRPDRAWEGGALLTMHQDVLLPVLEDRARTVVVVGEAAVWDSTDIWPLRDRMNVITPGTAPDPDDGVEVAAPGNRT